MALLRTNRTALAAISLWATLAAASCGGSDSPALPSGGAAIGGPAAGEPSTGRAGSPTTERPLGQFSGPETPAPAAFELPAQGRPSAPDHNFSNRRQAMGPSYEALRERVNAGKDGWPTEVLAGIAEQRLRETLEAALAGEPPDISSWLAADFVAAGSLRPSELELVPDTGALRVRVAPLDPRREAAREPATAESFERALAELCAPFQSGSRREVSLIVTRMEPAASDSPRDFECLAEVRLSADMGLGALQVNAGWRVIWSLSADGKQVSMKQLELTRYEQLELDLRPLQEQTLALVGGSEFERLDLQVGSLETWNRSDRLAGTSSIYIGMQGMSVGDLDGDGLEDLYLAQPGGRPNRLFLQTQGAALRECGAEAQVDFLDETAGVLIVDMDGDGARDLLLGQGANLLICWNDGHAHFAQRTLLEGEDVAQIYSIDVADPDVDGDLDIYATRYVGGGVSGGVPTPYHDAENGASNFYWRGEGARQFVLATEEVGLGQNNTRFSLDSTWEDLDGDGDLDLYVTNDFGRNNLFRNEGGHFSDIAAETGTADMAAGMGISCADVDQDGRLDLYISNMFTAAGARVTSQPAFMRAGGLELRAMYQRHTRGNTLLLGNGNGAYRDGTQRAGVGPGGWTWGAMFSDLDNDGRADILVPNGFLSGARSSRDLESFFWRAVVNASPPSFPPTQAYREAWVAISNMSQREGLSWNGRERNYAYWNLGDGRFVDASALSGFDYIDDARCVCVVDWDQDGRLDAWVRNRTAPILRFLHNQSPEVDWIALELAGRAPNTDAIGALVTVRAKGRTIARRVYGGDGYLSGSSRRLNFGLGPPEPGASEARATVEVRWPDGSEQRFEGLELRRAQRLPQGGLASLVERPLSRELEGREPLRLPELTERALARVPALDKCPLSSLELPSFEGPSKRVADFAGAPLLIVLWGSWDDVSVRELRELAAAKQRLRAGGLSVYPITLDGPRDSLYARDALARIGLEEEGGRLDRRSRTVIEMAMMEILGNYEDLPLPIGLLLDGAGAPCVLYIEDLAAEQILADAALLRSDVEDPTWRWETALTGGRWAERGPFRALGPMGDFLRKAGFPELAQEFKVELERRKAQRVSRKQEASLEDEPAQDEPAHVDDAPSAGGTPSGGDR